MIFAGIDAGSRALKAVLWDAERQRVVAQGLREQGVAQARLARELFDRLLAEAGLPASEVRRTVATGYGRNLVEFADTTITEITCHARGVRHWEPAVKTVIEIGGQDSKLIRLNGHGHVRDFAMNDRCAAGTGRFLEMVAARLNVGLSELGALARHSTEPSAISSMCAVFAETEIVGLLAAGQKPADIVAGVQASIATRLTTMAGRNVEPPVCFTGGVALVTGMVEAVQTVLRQPVKLVAEPLFTGALGAAILAAERAE